MCFSAKNKTTQCIPLQIDGDAIAEVFKSKFLGVIIDWVGKIIHVYHLCVERSLVVSGL